MGAFVVTTGLVDEWAANSKDLDDYNSIMVKALADRFAEALPNICTKKYVRNLGYSADEVLTAEGMIAEGTKELHSWLSACPTFRKTNDLEITKCRTRNRSDIDGEYGNVASIIGFWILFRNPESKYFGLENKRRPSSRLRKT
jgi:5-methyltetrahydrofolate--homocysteine methyltransferase